jgi:hypothetical protein
MKGHGSSSLSILTKKPEPVPSSPEPSPIGGSSVLVTLGACFSISQSFISCNWQLERTGNYVSNTLHCIVAPHHILFPSSVFLYGTKHLIASDSVWECVSCAAGAQPYRCLSSHHASSPDHVSSHRASFPYHTNPHHTYQSRIL